MFSTRKYRGIFNKPKDIICSVSVTINVLNNILCLFTIDHIKSLKSRY